MLLAKYLIRKCNTTRSQSNSCIFYKKEEGGKLELVISVHVDDVFMSGRTKTLENIKELIKLKFTIQEFENVMRFLGLYYN